MAKVDVFAGNFFYSFQCFESCWEKLVSRSKRLKMRLANISQFTKTIIIFLFVRPLSKCEIIDSFPFHFWFSLFYFFGRVQNTSYKCLPDVSKRRDNILIFISSFFPPFFVCVCIVNRRPVSCADANVSFPLPNWRIYVLTQSQVREKKWAETAAVAEAAMSMNRYEGKRILKTCTCI